MVAIGVENSGIEGSGHLDDQNHPDRLKITILGCGGSNGVPQIGCRCYTCVSDNPKNTRTRVSILIEYAGKTVLVDASPDLRLQALRHNIKKIDAVIITHDHSDHIAGLDDLKVLSFNRGEPIPTYMFSSTYDTLYGRYRYAFEKLSDIYKPFLEAIIVDDYSEVEIMGEIFRFFPQIHGNIISLGLRIRDFAYSIDFKKLPERSLGVLRGIKTWIIDCQRYSWSPSHLNLEQSLKYIEIIGPLEAYLSHMSHEVEYEEAQNLLPENIFIGFDGMVLHK